MCLILKAILIQIKLKIMKTTDEELRKIARKRVEFKKHLRTYLIVNFVCWLIWFISVFKNENLDGFWPIWVTLGWGIGIVSHYYKAYHINTQEVEKEFEKLKSRQDKV